MLLIYPPFCTPASPPLALAGFYPNVKGAEVLDLNLKYHELKFPRYAEYFRKKKWEDYEEVASEYMKKSAEAYSENNNRVLDGEKPEFFDDLLKLIKGHETVAFSVVYSSQAFYTLALLKELDIPAYVGGPAVNSKLLEYAKGEKEFFEEHGLDHEPADFSFAARYFTPEPVIPLRTSNTCPYKQCAFCSHYSEVEYMESDLDQVRKTIRSSGAKHFFVVDDMIPPGRLVEVADMFKELGVRWACQLRPTGIDEELLKKLAVSGLVMVIWGVESASDRVLGLMRKGTNVREIKQTLKTAHEQGIANVVNIMFGFPGERKEEMQMTIDFLLRNASIIDLVSTSVFGLQKGSYIYDHPEDFGVSFTETERTVLDPKISYSVAEGVTQEDANAFRKKNMHVFDRINKYPKAMNFFREHMILCL